MKPLNPLMAALLAATSVVSVFPRISQAEEAPPKTAPAAVDCAKLPKDEHPINVLTCFMAEKKEAREDMGKRLAAFVVEKDFQGRSYIREDLRQEANKKKLDAILGPVKDWPERNKDKPERVATLYFVLGPGDDVPAWAKVPQLAGFKKGMDSTRRLQLALAGDDSKYSGMGKRWTGADQLSLESLLKDGAAPLPFIEDAADCAEFVFNDHRTLEQIRESVKQNETTALVVPVAPKNSSLVGTGKGFTSEDLYIRGAVTAKVWGAEDDGYRMLSVKIYTVKNDDGSMTNKIGVVDISQGDTSVPFYIPLDKRETTFSLRPGGRQYKFSVKPTVDGKHVFTLLRDGKEGGGITEKDGKTIEDALFLARAEQISTCGQVTIEGKEYYVLGQGGEKGSDLFFDKEDIDNRSSVNLWQMHPAGMATVSMVDPNGEGTVPVKWKPELGDFNGKPYHLEYDAALQMWQVVQGKGEKEPKPGSPATPGTPPPAPNPGKPGGANALDDARDPAGPEGPGSPASKQAAVFRPYDGKYTVVETDNSKEYYDVANLVKFLNGQGPSMSGIYIPSPRKPETAAMREVKDVAVAVDILDHYRRTDKNGGDIDQAIAALRAAVGNLPAGSAYTIEGREDDLRLYQGKDCTSVVPGKGACEPAGAR